MELAAIAVAVFGAATGLAFRWKVLLPVIVLLPVASIVASTARGLGLRETVVVIILAEAILQGGYFAGLLIRHIVAAGMRAVPSIFDRRRNSDQEEGGQRHTAPNAGIGKGP